jgi:outer membrane receptor for ferrienterochelin and colicins
MNQTKKTALVTGLLCAAVMSTIAGPSLAQQRAPGNPDQLPDVEVRAQRGSLNDRFNSPGSRVIVTKEDIENMGADTVTDVLKGLPGVTTSTGANGQTEIRMRGMDRGATQILVDGERQNNARRGGGLPIDQIPADLIERVEVIRAPMAEFSGASGGTINIVLKQAVVQRETTVRLSNQFQFDQNAASLFFGKTGPFYDPPTDNNKRPANERVIPPSYFFGMSVYERLGGNDRNAQVDTTYATGPFLNNPDREMREEVYRQHTKEILLFPRANFRISAKDQLALNFFVNAGRTSSWADSESKGQRTGNQFTSIASEYNQASRGLGRVSATWNHRFESTRLETRATIEKGGEKNDRNATTSTVGLLGQGLVNTQQIDDRNEKSWTLNTKLTAAETTHIWTFGGEIEKRDFDTVTTNLINTLSNTNVYTSGQTRLSAFAQDEWTVFTDGTFTTGLRVERLKRNTDSAGTFFEDKWTRYQPNINLRLPIDKEQQVRIGLSGLNKIPAVSDVIDRVVLSTGLNSSTRPDTVGNPKLKSERTLSLDTGWEYRNAKGVQIGLNAFLRNGKDPVIRPTVFTNGRWVQQPINGIDSKAWGLESDVRAPLAPIGLQGFFVNASASWLASKVDFGPAATGANADGRIPGQPHYTVNININKPMPRTGGWFGGAIVNLTGASDLADTGSSSGRTRSIARLDLRAGYVFAGIGMLQVGVNNVTNTDRNRVRFDVDNIVGSLRTETINDSGARSVFIALATRF